MQDAEFMDSNRAQMVTKLIRLHLSGYRREMRVAEVFLAACLMGAGYCLFRLILSIAGATKNSPDFLKATDWPIWVLIFGITGVCLFVFAFSRLSQLNNMVVESDRAALLIAFGTCEKLGITFSGEEIISVLGVTPRGTYDPKMAEAAKASQKRRTMRIVK